MGQLNGEGRMGDLESYHSTAFLGRAGGNWQNIGHNKLI